jgi:ABC-type glycerol-3-phosphate transport system permease component
MNAIERTLQAIEHKLPDRVPVDLHNFLVTARMMGADTVALSNLAGGRAVQWNLPMAGAILAAVPTLLVYIILGRYFIRGLLAGSVKG